MGWMSGGRGRLNGRDSRFTSTTCASGRSSSIRTKARLSRPSGPWLRCAPAGILSATVKSVIFTVNLTQSLEARSGLDRRVTHASSRCSRESRNSSPGFGISGRSRVGRFVPWLRASTSWSPSSARQSSAWDWRVTTAMAVDATPIDHSARGPDWSDHMLLKRIYPGLFRFAAAYGRQRPRVVGCWGSPLVCRVVVLRRVLRGPSRDGTAARTPPGCSRVVDRPPPVRRPTRWGR